MKQDSNNNKMNIDNDNNKKRRSIILPVFWFFVNFGAEIGVPKTTEKNT